MEKEIWKDICGYEGIYQISSEGSVKRLERVVIDRLGRRMPYPEKILKPRISKGTGYPNVNLSKNGKTKSWCIHKLIADAFIPNPNNLPCINHIDENRANSVLSNLERCTYSYNNSYGSAREKRREALRKHYERNGMSMNTLQNDVHLSVIQYTTDGEAVAFFKNGFPEIKEKLGYGSSVSSCLCHKNKTAYGYVWRYDGDDFSYSTPKTNKGRKFENVIKSHQKYVIQIDEQGNEIRRYKSISKAAKENGFDRHCLSRKKNENNCFTINGLRFIVEKKENEYIPTGHKGPRPDLKGKGAKRVCMYTKEGVFVQEFQSIIDAAENIGSTRCTSEISNCCHGKLKTARGFIWRFKDDDAPEPFVNEAVREIEQYTLSGEYVNSYSSIVEAANAMNGRPGSINNNLRGASHSAYGYIWKYTKV